jgi:hypothetical protein
LADQKITELTNYTPPIPTDVLPIVDVTTPETKKITIANLSAYLAALTETLTNKTLTSPKINENVAITATATELNYTDGVTSAIQTQLNTKAVDADVVHDTGNETIAGVKTFSSDPLIPDEAYGSGWNGVLEPPTKNAVYDKIESLTSGSTTAVDSTQNVYNNFTITFSGSGATPTGDTWDVGGTLNAATRWNGNLLRVTSGANIDISQSLPGSVGSSSAFYQFGSTKDIVISFNAKFSSVTGQCGVGIVDATAAFYDVTTSAGKLMFTFDGTTLNAVNGEATTNTTTDISSGLTLTNWNNFRIVYNYGTNILFYVNNVLKATHTTNRPTSSNNGKFGIGFATTGKTAELSNVVISIEQ